MHANVRLHKNDHGLLTALSTNAIDEGDFLAAVSDLLQHEIGKDIHHTLEQTIRLSDPDKLVNRHELWTSEHVQFYDGKAIDATVGLFGILLARVLPHIVEVSCRLRGYKSDVIEHRVIVAGTVLPSDVVDLLPNELAELERA